MDVQTDGLIVDNDRRMTMAYVMNPMAAGVLGDSRGRWFIKATDAALAD